MTSVDDLWYLSDEADQQAEQTRHVLSEQYDDFLTFETTKHVSRRRFRTVAERIRDNGAPYGAHTLVTNESSEILLVRHDVVGMWVLPGGETHSEETFRDCAERELCEEAGITADYDGLGLLGTVTFTSGDHTTWGVLPMFEAKATPDAGEPTVKDPDDEISAARWFADPPADTRDRGEVLRWREQRLD